MGIFKVKGSPHYHFAFTIRGQRYRGSTSTDKRADAETIYGHLRRNALLGEIEKPAISLEHAFIKYEEEHAMFLSSYEAVQAHVNSLLAYFGKSKLLHEIGRNDLERYIAKCRGDTYTRKAGGKEYPISSATINRRIAAFQGMHNKSKSWNVMRQEIDFYGLKLKERTVGNNTLERSDLPALLEAAPLHIQRFIMITLYVGWRKRNVLSLNGKEQINLANRTITTIGKGGKLIVSPITDSFLSYIKANNLHELERVIEFEGEAVRDIKTGWKALFERTGLKYIRPHDLRHTYGTWLYEGTGDQRLVQEMLKHSDIRTSIRYTHTKLDSQRKRVNKAMRILEPCQNSAIASGVFKRRPLKNKKKKA